MGVRWAGLAVVVVAAAGILVAALLAVSGRLNLGPDSSPRPDLALSRAFCVDPPDLIVDVGTPGYIPSLVTEGAQQHYYDPVAGGTTIWGEIRVGDEHPRVPVADYRGPGTREVAGENLRIVPTPPLAVLVVRIVDAGGALRGRVGATVRALRDLGRKGHQERWGEDGEVRFLLLGPGTYSVDADGAAAGEVAIAAREKVVCTLGPSGLRVDARMGP